LLNYFIVDKQISLLQFRLEIHVEESLCWRN